MNSCNYISICYMLQSMYETWINYLNFILFLLENAFMIRLEDIKDNSSSSGMQEIDARGSQCPGPIMSLMDTFKTLAMGKQVKLVGTDPGLLSDLPSWANITGNKLISIEMKEGLITAVLEKHTENGHNPLPDREDRMTIVLFSDDFDKSVAAFNIALGALAVGMKVEIFFTFWGLSLLRRKPDHPIHKDLEGRMMAEMLPKSDQDLPLSKDNMMGIGAKLLQKIMKDKHIPPLDFMVHLAKYDGVKFIACQMSMEVMEISKDELLEGVEVGGVATMLENARKSTTSYFI